MFQEKNKNLWGKKLHQSSSFGAWRENLCLENQKLARQIVFLCVLAGFTPVISAKETVSRVVLDIPQQRAYLSLIYFAEQADISLLFSFEKVEGIDANAISGSYNVMDGLARLLENTGLYATMSEGGQISILYNKNHKRQDDMTTNKNKVASAVLAAMGALSTSHTLAAEEANTAAPEIEVIKVSGIRGSLSRSMDVKRSSEGVVDSISSEDIGKFPDTNLAESLQRITGVSIDRSGGEGQSITVRGFGPEFNTVLVNGRQVASESDTRGFSFDTIAAEMVRSLDVYKTSSATMQSGGIGSTVNINTAKPFAMRGFKVAGNVKGVYDENSEQTSPQFSGLISNTFLDDTFGVLFGLSHQERQTRLNQAQVDGWLENVGIPNPKTASGANYTGNIFSARNYDHKVTFEDRSRTNANLVLQFAPSDDLELTADVLYSDFDVETNSTSYGHWFTAPNVTGVNGGNPIVDGNGTVVDMYQEVGLATDFHAKKFDRLTETKSFGFNADWNVNDSLNMAFDISHSEALREANNGRGDQLSLIGYANRVRFQVNDNVLPLSSMFATANPNIYSGQQELDGQAYDPAFTPAGVQDYLNPQNSRAHVMLRRGWEVEDNVDQLKWDNNWLADGNSGLSGVKFGAMYSSEEKSLSRWDNEGAGIHCTYCGYPDAPVIGGTSQYVFDAGNNFLSGVSGSGLMPTSWLAHDGEANFAFLEQYYASQNGSNISFDAVLRDKSYTVEENIFSMYFEIDFTGELSGMPISSRAGVRYENTDTQVSGRDKQITQLNILDKTEMLPAYGAVQSISQDNSYDAILPNFSVKLDISDDLIARLAASETLTRPTLNSMSPVTVINTTRPGGDLTSSQGNPALKPFSSSNIDLSLEWYYDDVSYVSAGYFRKNVDNFIVNTQEDLTFTLSDGSLLTDPSTGSNTNLPDSSDGVAHFNNTRPNNGESAIVQGWELAAQHTFGESGFGVMANATLVDSNAELDPANISQVFALTGLSDSVNLVAFYEDGPIQTRLAWNWRDAFVQSLTQNNGDGPTIVESYAQLDLSGSYELTDNVAIFFEGINLTEEYVHKRGRFGNQLLLIEDSGRRFALGVRGSY